VNSVATSVVAALATSAGTAIPNRLTNQMMSTLAAPDAPAAIALFDPIVGFMFWLLLLQRLTPAARIPVLGGNPRQPLLFLIDA
jgi:hypothetical protein